MLVNQAKANLSVGKAQLSKDQTNPSYAKVTYEQNLRLVETHVGIVFGFNSACKVARLDLIESLGIACSVKSELLICWERLGHGGDVSTAMVLRR
jgi:hypothetical protein